MVRNSEFQGTFCLRHNVAINKFGFGFRVKALLTVRLEVLQPEFGLVPKGWTGTNYIAILEALFSFHC